MRRTPKKLNVNPETVRRLSTDELSTVQGGKLTQTYAMGCSLACGPTYTCPPPGNTTNTCV